MFGGCNPALLLISSNWSKAKGIATARRTYRAAILGFHRNREQLPTNTHVGGATLLLQCSNLLAREKSNSAEALIQRHKSNLARPFDSNQQGISAVYSGLTGNSSELRNTSIAFLGT